VRTCRPPVGSYGKGDRVQGKAPWAGRGGQSAFHLAGRPRDPLIIVFFLSVFFSVKRKHVCAPPRAHIITSLPTNFLRIRFIRVYAIKLYTHTRVPSGNALRGNRTGTCSMYDIIAAATPVVSEAKGSRRRRRRQGLTK